MIKNIFLDRLGGNPNNTNTTGIQSLNRIINKHNLMDIWRKTNPYQRYFTYHNANNTIHSRLHRFYIRRTIKNVTCQIVSTSISGHDSVSVTLEINEK